MLIPVIRAQQLLCTVLYWQGCTPTETQLGKAPPRLSTDVLDLSSNNFGLEPQALMVASLLLSFPHNLRLSRLGLDRI